MRRVVILVSLAVAGPAAAQAPDQELGFGVALGIQPSPTLVCAADGDSVSCTDWLPAWGLRAQGTLALGPRLAASLVAGFGTDLDASERVTSDGGRGENGRQFADLVLRGRYDLGREGKTGWVGLEAGVVMARDWSADFAASGQRLTSAAVAQFAPVLGATAAVVLLRERSFALDLELGGRLTMFGSQPPPLRPGSASFLRGSTATEYGTRPWVWFGLGGRLGR